MDIMCKKKYGERLDQDGYSVWCCYRHYWDFIESIDNTPKGLRKLLQIKHIDKKVGYEVAKALRVL